MTRPRIVQELKRDALGHIELVELAPARGAEGEGEGDAPRVVRRVAAARLGLGWVARVLAGRERRALGRVGGLLELPDVARLPDLRGRVPRPSEVVVRDYIAGSPLHRAEALPRDFFELLEAEVAALHAAGVCHNDLHKEQNIVVRADGRPALIDFQLASVHVRRGRKFEARCHDDLRHVQKHRRRYTRDGRGPAELRVADAARMPRTWVARVWRRTAKPLYNFVTRRVLGLRDGEERRPSVGPWPRWTGAIGRGGQGGRGGLHRGE